MALEKSASGFGSEFDDDFVAFLVGVTNDQSVRKQVFAVGSDVALGVGKRFAYQPTGNCPVEAYFRRIVIHPLSKVAIAIRMLFHMIVTP